MNMREIPLDSDNPYFSQKVELSGRTYEMQFHWNGVAGKWYFALDLDETRIVEWMPVVCNFPFLKPVFGKSVPQEALVFISEQEFPGRFDLGTNVRLVLI